MHQLVLPLSWNPWKKLGQLSNTLFSSVLRGHGIENLSPRKQSHTQCFTSELYLNRALKFRASLQHLPLFSSSLICLKQRFTSLTSALTVIFKSIFRNPAVLQTQFVLNLIPSLLGEAEFNIYDPCSCKGVFAILLIHVTGLIIFSFLKCKYLLFLQGNEGELLIFIINPEF